MRIGVREGDIVQADVEAVVVNLFEGVDSPGGATGAVDVALGGKISDLIARERFKGKMGEVAVLESGGRLPATEVILSGLGKAADFTPERVWKAAATAAKKAQELGLRSLATVAHGAGVGGLEADVSAFGTAVGSLLGAYRYLEYKGEKPNRELAEIDLWERDRAKVAVFGEAVRRAEIVAQAVALARDLVNRPPVAKTPEKLAEAALDLGRETGLEVEVLEPPALEALGMGGLLGVARGSAVPPRLIVLRHRGTGGGKTLGLVGKGLTFDSGGISLKPADGMEEMKGDMAGGAAVLAAMGAVARLKLPGDFLGIIPATENMPGGGAQKPGDILRTMRGKTVEVINTDAEGRLILADALTYAAKLQAAAVVDLATLTGACVVALGHVASGLLGNDSSLLAAVEKAAGAAGERVWRLPLFDDYKEQLKSEVADLKNVGGRPAGTITAAWFLAEFVEELPWAHLDIAGTFFNAKPAAWAVAGGTGVGVLTLVELARQWSA